jgi:hypothetical protein
MFKRNLFKVFIALSVLSGCLCGTAFASTSYGTLHTYTFSDVTYVYRNGWECNSAAVFPFLKAKSYMWVKNTNRAVGDGAICSQAGLTNINQLTLNSDTVFGSEIWNSGTNAAGNAIESTAEEYIPMYCSVTSWGNGFVRDPDSNYHHCGTEENVVYAYE